MREFAPGDIIQHFKRETVDQNGMQYLYEYIGEATHSETREKMIVYRALYGEKKLFVRPYEMFMEWLITQSILEYDKNIVLKKLESRIFTS